MLHKTSTVNIQIITVKPKAIQKLISEQTRILLPILGSECLSKK